MVSVVIVNWNTRDFLLACLRSLTQFQCPVPVEIIVVDNASSDGSAEAVRNQFPEIILVDSGGNLGYAKGNNLGFSRAKGEYLLTLNPDTEFDTRQLPLALEILDSSSSLAAIGIRQVYVDGTTQHSIRGFPSVRGIAGDLLGIGKSKPRTPWDSYRLTAFDYDKEQLAPQPMGTFLLLKRSSLESLGDIQNAFDEQFPIFFNEVDLLYRLKCKGLDTLYTPRIQVLHHGGEGTRQVKKSMIWESHKSLVRFMRKHYRTPWNALFFPIFAGIVYLGALARAKGYHAGFKA